MNVVIYTNEMEPITVIELPMWALEAGGLQGFVRVAVPDNTPMGFLNPGDPVPRAQMRVVTLEFLPVRLHKMRSWMIVTKDDELALLLTPSWLPGQRSKVNQYERTVRDLSKSLLDVLARGVGGH